MPRITISYRRDDSSVITGRIFDRLTGQYGRDAIFRDIDSIPPGVDFREFIAGVISGSDVLLAIVGPKWIGARGAHHRLDDEADPVRVEIESALLKSVPIIPVLVLNAVMPRLNQLPGSIGDFAYRNAVRVDADQDFDIHMGRLVRALDRLFEPKTTDAVVAPLEPSDAGLVPISIEAPAFGAELLAEVERDLAASIGPLAGIATRRAAGQIRRLDELYRALANHIPDDDHRAQFLMRGMERARAREAAASEPIPPPPEAAKPAAAIDLSPNALQQLETGLALYIGPIARVVLRKQLPQAASLDALLAALATFIPEERDRARFLAHARDL